MKNFNLFGVICLIFGGIALLSFGSLDTMTGTNIFGEYGHNFSKLFIAHFLGFTAYFFPFFFLYAGYQVLKGKDKYFFINKTLFYGNIFFTIFLFNVLALNFKLFLDSDWAGLFPKLFHFMLIHYLGKSMTLLVGSGLLILMNFKYIKQIPLKSILSNLQFKIPFDKVNFDFIQKMSFRDFGAEIETSYLNAKGIIFRLSEGPDGKFYPYQFTKQLAEVKTDKPVVQDFDEVDIKYSEDKHEENISVSSNVKQEAISSESIIPIKSYTEKYPKRDGEFYEVPTADVDFDLSDITMGKAKIKKDMSEDQEGESEEALIIIDPEKKPTVLNPKMKNYFKKSEIRILADSSFLEKSEISIRSEDFENTIRETATKLEKTIAEFGIVTKVVGVSTGPVITQYELSLEPGVKLSRIVNLSDNLALSLSAPSVRIVAPLPGKGVIGIEIPNPKRQMIRIQDIVYSEAFEKSDFPLPMVLGKSIMGESVVKNIATTPHLLIAGATGSGKSVCVNAIIISLLLKKTSSEVRLLMIDPKMVELTVYNGIPHLLSPVITDAKKAGLALRWVIAEMESRYYLLEKFGARSISSFNEIIQNKKNKNEAIEDELGTLPYIVVIIDEFADLMMVARKEVEDSVTRLAAMSRAVGIHLILATQRPSVDVITGVIKANFPTRIAFQVSSKIDSRTIIDANGADQLLGKGDMLYSDSTSMVPERIQGAYLSDAEVHKVIKDLKSRGKTDYIEDIFAIGENTDKNALNEIQDDLFDEAVQIVIMDKKASASYLQRKLKIGYNRAARIVELMEDLGIVGSADGSRPREVLITHWQGSNHN